MKMRLITSALPYVNNVPHMGNLIQVLSADCFARYCRLAGYETCYVCGTDEYGTATETRAAESGITPRELCDRYYNLHAGIYKWFNISFDKFGRTSTPYQTGIVQDIFKKLDAAGFITEKTVEQLYCEKCGRFLADRYVLGACPHCGADGARGDQCENCGKLLEPTELKNPRCSSCNNPPVVRSTKHLYIDLPKLRGLLEAWIAKASVEGEWANNALQMTHAWIRDGLHERAITRDLKWGIPVPKDGWEDKVFYVWFDAPIGYVSITANLGEDLKLDPKTFVDRWWKNPQNVELFQFIGKDNIPFHTVIFPSSQLGTGENWTMLHHMSSSEYLNYESGKFSKSKGVGVFGSDVMETGIDADIWRFYIFYNRPEKSDTLFTWKDFAEKVNSELIGNLGNFINRTLSFVTRYYGGTIPADEPDDNPSSSTVLFWETVRNYENAIKTKLDRAQLRDAFHLLFELTSFANKTFQDGEPWKTRTEKPEAAAALIRNLTFLVRDIAVLAHPFIPAAAEKIAAFLGLKLACGTLAQGAPNTGNQQTENAISWNFIGKPEGASKVLKAEVLFTKLEAGKITELREKYSGTQKERQEQAEQTPAAPDTGSPNKSTKPPLPQEIQFVNTIDLRVAKITRIEKHPKANKLYIETLDIAGEERTIVSGLVPYYTEEQLLNKHIIVAYNLKAAKLRGTESRGMLLAASVKNADGSETVEVLDAGCAPTGARVTVEGGTPPNEALIEIDIDTFFSLPIVVQDTVVKINGKALMLNDKPIQTKIVKNGGVG
ncbi:methionine--tRNA ligase [Spirochaetia bacterium]|nr:methionine--tRNA ligase [Spirochaetia bacterium]